MVVVKVENGYITLQLDQRDCQLLTLAAKVARGHPDEIGHESDISQVETLSALFTLAGITLSAQVNMCHQDHLDHIEHLAEQSLGLPLVVH